MNVDVASLRRELQSQVELLPALAPYDIVSAALPSVRFTTNPEALEWIELGASRMGGLPDVPRDFQWPRWTPGQPTKANPFPKSLGLFSFLRKLWGGKREQPSMTLVSTPLAFLAQLDLSELPRVDSAAPVSGWLYFFYETHSQRWGYDPADRGCCRVLYVDCERSSLVRASIPPDAGPEFVARACAVSASAEMTLPEETKELAEVDYNSPAWRAYETLYEQFSQAGHRFLGHPQPVQGPMELECQLVTHGIYCGDSTGYQSERAETLATGAGEWRLLLQVDSDEAGPGWMWGDGGCLYFWIKRQDLQAARFAEVWLILQCY